ncbi:MAG: hypothetical protein FWC83_02825, partial [Alphaproteobacteria bacterium]|nr:hypothetical protein [Alphaproteobacteria bacterium]
KYGTIVLAYGLRTDFLERKFKNVIRMEEKGAKITTMYSTCINKKECISKATHVVRLDKPKDEGGLPIFKGAQKVVGHNYEPMCLDCYEQAKADWKMRTKKQRNQK